MYGTLSALALTATALLPATSSVASSARQGPDDTATARGVEVAAERAGAQRVTWGSCPDVENLPAPVRCGTVTVPVDYAKPEGDTLTLTVSRLAASGPRTQRKGPLVFNPGGPGGSGMDFPLYAQHLGGTWEKLNKSYDFIGYAPRGVGRSTPISCQDPQKYVRAPRSSPREPSELFKWRKNTEAAEYAAGCAERQGSRLTHVNTPNNARDLEVIRAALGQNQLSYLGISYGSYIGSVYATLFPHRVRALVLDSVVNPAADRVWYQSNLDQSLAFEDRWTDWKTWVAQHHDVYALGQTPVSVQRAFDEVRDQLDAQPANGRVGSKELLDAYLDTGYADSLWAARATALSEFRKGNERYLVATAAPDPKRAVSAENGTAVYTTTLCNDASWPRDFATWDRDNSQLAAKAPFVTWDNAWLNLPCAYWPERQVAPTEVGARPGALPPTLLLASTGDAATPYEGAREMRRRLPDSVLVTERNAGHHGLSGGPNSCVNQHLERYLLKGSAPAEDTDCAGRAEPAPAYDVPRASDTNGGLSTAVSPGRQG